jgi:Tat protein translocase TatB subunit
MGDIGFSELVVIVIIAILIYGKDLPQAARKLASIYSKFRRQLTDIKDEIQRQIPVEEIKSEFNKDLNAGMEPPSTPYNLTASPAEDRIHLSWDYASGATGYTVKRSRGKLEPYSTLAMSIPDLSYTDTDVTPGQTWCYVVSAQNSAGESGDSNDVEATVPGGTPAPAPSASADNPAAPPAEAPAAAAPPAEPPKPPEAAGNGNPTPEEKPAPTS